MIAKNIAKEWMAQQRKAIYGLGLTPSRLLVTKEMHTRLVCEVCRRYGFGSDKGIMFLRIPVLVADLTGMESFVEACRQDPDARLVWADWCEEHGNDLAHELRDPESSLIRSVLLTKA